MAATFGAPMVAGNRRSTIKIITRLYVILVILTGAAAVACSPAPDNSDHPSPPASSFPSSPSATAPTLPNAKIESLRDKDTVSSTVTAVEGTSTGVVGTPNEIWVVVLPAGPGRFHPQTPPAVVTPDGRWRASNVHFGQPGQSGLNFTIYAVVATEAASAEFRRYFEGHTTDFPGLPQLPYGATPTHDITVTTR